MLVDPLHVRTDVPLLQKDDESGEEEAVMNLKGVNGGGSSGSGSESSEESEDDDSDVSELPEVGFFFFCYYFEICSPFVTFYSEPLVRFTIDTLDSGSSSIDR